LRGAALCVAPLNVIRAIASQSSIVARFSIFLAAFTVSLPRNIKTIAPFSKLVGRFSIVVAIDLKGDRDKHKFSLQQNDIGRDVDYEWRD
jgi:hypothetical protein